MGFELPVSLPDADEASVDEYVPPPEDVVRNAEAVASEIRGQITLQASASDSLDNRAAAVLVITGAVAGIVATRVHADTPAAWASLTLASILAIGALGGCLRTMLTSERGFSNGASASELLVLIEKQPYVNVIGAIADSLTSARAKNEERLRAKATPLSVAVACLVGGMFAIALMVVTGAIR